MVTDIILLGGRRAEVPDDGVLRGVQVVTEGDPACDHDYFLYVDNAFDGQSLSCDMAGCRRKVRVDYTPGCRIEFPEGAHIRTPNPELGGGRVYTHVGNALGKADELGPDDRVLVRDVEGLDPEILRG